MVSLMIGLLTIYLMINETIRIQIDLIMISVAFGDSSISRDFSRHAKLGCHVFASIKSMTFAGHPHDSSFQSQNIDSSSRDVVNRKQG